jgi:hypothetical protein
MTPRIFVTRRLAEGAMQALAYKFDVQCNPHDRVLAREELLAGVKGKDGKKAPPTSSTFPAVRCWTKRPW